MSAAQRPFHVAVGCVAVGLGVSPAAPHLALVAAVGAGLLVAACRAPWLAPLAAALVMAGAALGDARLAALDAPAARMRDGSAEELRVHLATRPRPSAFGASAEAQVAAGPLRGARLLLRVPRWGELPRGVEVGDELAVSGRVRHVDPSFDFAAHLRVRGIAAELLLDRASATGRRRGGASS